MIYTVTFNPALDYTVWTENLKSGAVNRITHQELFCGGKGINVSLVLKELNVESTALGFIAGFTGAELERRLNADGIKTDFIELSDGITRINVKVKGNAETDLNAAGPDIDAKSVNQLFSKLDMLKSGDILVLAGSVPKSMPDDIYSRILEHTYGRGVMTVVDATGGLLKKVLKFKPFLIKPNNFELEEIVGRKLSDEKSITEAAVELQKLGAVNVLVSMAKYGAILVDEDGVSRKIGTALCKAVNSVGAGDSMVAGFIAGYIKSGDYGYALKLGTAAGGATASSEGLGKAAEIEKLFKLL